MSEDPNAYLARRRAEFDEEYRKENRRMLFQAAWIVPLLLIVGPVIIVAISLWTNYLIECARWLTQ
jgi:hypothetical protein